ncbi:hypothetical protein VC82_683 [Flagellimonas lutaonensis]|uniref:Uncharacterized protein n=1 Tax=Flagellimonas lutaonensis TaxID=516051 RepID=A0A0D5YQZ9_9FLAO|nr:hypothetical protein VC82_683 [Allomuricauda lutaonensis]
MIKNFLIVGICSMLCSFNSYADCYTEYKWCSNLADYFFVQNLAWGSPNAEAKYMSDMRDCFGELVDCANFK